nr:hypothetical protein CFP56_07552 [Quercus suber]
MAGTALRLAIVADEIEVLRRGEVDKVHRSEMTRSSVADPDGANDTRLVALAGQVTQPLPRPGRPTTSVTIMASVEAAEVEVIGTLDFDQTLTELCVCATTMLCMNAGELQWAHSLLPENIPCATCVLEYLPGRYPHSVHRITPPIVFGLIHISHLSLHPKRPRKHR